MTSTDTSTRRRVKLYALNADRQWDDRGTGHVTSSYVDRLKGKINPFWNQDVKILKLQMIVKVCLCWYVPKMMDPCC